MSLFKINCLYLKASYYAVFYAGLVLLGFLMTLVGIYLGVGWLEPAGFFTVIVPAFPFMPLLGNFDMVIHTGLGAIPSDAGLLVAHTIWFAFFYFSYLVVLLLKRKCATSCALKK